MAAAAVAEPVTTPRGLSTPKWRQATDFALSTFRKQDTMPSRPASGTSPDSPSFGSPKGTTPTGRGGVLSKLWTNSTFEDQSGTASPPPSAGIKAALADDISSPRDSPDAGGSPVRDSAEMAAVQAAAVASALQLAVAPSSSVASLPGMGLFRNLVTGRPSSSRQSSNPEDPDNTPVIGFHEQFVTEEHGLHSPLAVPPTPGSPLDLVASWEQELRRMMRSGTMLEEALERPGPSAGMARCCVRRIKNFLGTSCVFELQLERGHMMLLAARKRKKSKVSAYVISRDSDDLKRNSNSCVAKLKANFVGTEYLLWGKSPDPSVKKGFATEQVCLSFKPSSIEGGPHTMHAALPLPDSGWRPMATEDQESPSGAGAEGRRGEPLGGGGGSQLGEMLEQAKQRSLSPAAERRLSLLTSKPPEYDEQQKVYCLDFGGRVKQYSVKNMQLVCWDHSTSTPGSQVVLQFGKVGDDHYVLDFAYPLSVKTAFGIALAKLDTKLCYMLG